ncbi:MAG: PIN domain-containing protein [Candidatus Micrarchaeota archaeon]
MRLVVDTNVIISALIRDSAARQLLLHLDAELVTINFSKKEMNRYEKEILNKAGITKEELYQILDSLLSKMIILDDMVVQNEMDKAKQIMDEIDKNGAPFIAAALATDSAIWSDDKHFEKQRAVKVYKTKDLIKYLTRSAG